MVITLILASIRPNRESEKPALYIRDRLEAAGHTVDFLDLRDMNLPLFNDAPEQYALPQVQRLIDSVKTSDGVVAVFPEYNHMYSSAFKNAIDFLRKREPRHRPVGLVGVSDGMVGGARAIFAARGSLPTLGAVILPTVVTIPVVPITFPDAHTCTDPKVDGLITSMIKEMEAYAPALAKVREQLGGQV